MPKPTGYVLAELLKTGKPPSLFVTLVVPDGTSVSKRMEYDAKGLRYFVIFGEVIEVPVVSYGAEPGVQFKPYASAGKFEFIVWSSEGGTVASGDGILEGDEPTIEIEFPVAL